MSERPTILVIGTFDTKAEELAFLCERIRAQGANVVTMDVSVLGEADEAVDVSKHDVARAAGRTIEDAIGAADENEAMQIMASGAAFLCADLVGRGRVTAMVGLGGTMGTDLLLDCASALPLGVPKVIVSTVAFSPLIPPDRLAPDLQMVLWAGGLYGLNAICRSSLAQAAGAVVGAARAAEPPRFDRPVIGMTSLGSSCLRYMTLLQEPLRERGFDLAVFHSTGMGGMAFEAMAEKGVFAAVLDLCLQEVANGFAGSLVHSGAARLSSAGAAGVPQIVAPGCSDLVDFAGWQTVPAPYADRPFHDHNRLIRSTTLTGGERRALMRHVAERLGAAKGPVHFVLPLRGVEEWDRTGEPAHDPEALAAMVDEARRAIGAAVPLTEVDAHINDQAFANAVLAILDGWIADGTIDLR